MLESKRRVKVERRNKGARCSCRLGSSTCECIGGDSCRWLLASLWAELEEHDSSDDDGRRRALVRREALHGVAAAEAGGAEQEHGHGAQRVGQAREDAARA